MYIYTKFTQNLVIGSDYSQEKPGEDFQLTFR